MAIRIGMDLGGTKTHLASVNDQGEIKDKLRVEYPQHKEYGAVLEKISRALRELIENSRQQGESIVGIGIGVAAQVAGQTQRILSAPNLGWKNVDIKQDLEALFHLPVFVDNDVRSATMGEYVVGLKKQYKNLINIALGTGIGGGIMINGQLLRGQNNVAGEIGHVIYQAGGPSCGCQRHGCTEAYSGGAFYQARLREIVRQYDASSLATASARQHFATLSAQVRAEELVSLKDIYQLKSAGDPLGQCLWDAFIQPVGLLTANLVTIFNPELVIFGGGLMQICPEILPAVREVVWNHAMVFALTDLKLMASTLQDNAMLLGAAFLVNS
jgi:glucokinase